MVHHRPGCLKAGPSKGVCGLDCDNDGMSSKPSLGKDITDGTQSVHVSVCGSDRCKACVHIIEGNTFTSNVNKCKYNVKSPTNGRTLDCGSSKVIYLISCRKCGVQYVGKTAQTLRCRLNNHRNRIKQLVELYLYNHFSSDGHSINALCIMPIGR